MVIAAARGMWSSAHPDVRKAVCDEWVKVVAKPSYIQYNDISDGLVGTGAGQARAATMMLMCNSEEWLLPAAVSKKGCLDIGVAVARRIRRVTSLFESVCLRMEQISSQ